MRKVISLPQCLMQVTLRVKVLANQENKIDVKT